MGDTYAILALRRKRARIAGEIEKAERAIQPQRDLLAILDATLRIFEPTSNPELIAAIQPRLGNNPFFRKGELGRLCTAALHNAAKPLPAARIRDYAVKAKGLALERRLLRAVDNQVRQVLNRMEAKGMMRKIVSFPEVWWELTDYAVDANRNDSAT